MNNLARIYNQKIRYAEIPQTELKRLTGLNDYWFLSKILGKLTKFYDLLIKKREELSKGKSSLNKLDAIVSDLHDFRMIRSTLYSKQELFENKAREIKW